MGKRGNENAQMSKEDYDAMEARRGRNGGNDNGGGGEGFQRASAEQMKARRKLAVRRPQESANVPSPSAASSNNPFANLGGFGKPAAAAATTTASSSATTPAAGLFNFKTPPAPVSTFPTTNTTTAVASTTTAFTKPSTTTTPTPAQQRAVELEKELVKQIKSVDGEEMGASLENTILYSYTKYAAAQIMDWAEKNPSLAGRDKKSSQFGGASPTTKASVSPPPPSKPAFGAPSTTTTTTAPTTSTVGFGFAPSAAPASKSGFSFSPSAPAPAPATGTGGFKVGASSPTTTTTSPPAAASKFSFSGGTMAAAPAASSTLSFGSFAASTEAANKAAAAAPTPGFSFGSPPAPAATDDDDNTPLPVDDDGPSVVEESDEGWDDVQVIEPVTFWQMKDPPDDKTWTNIQKGGKVRLQKEKDKNGFRILMRDKAGLKVLLNCTITSNTQLNPKISVNKRKIEVGTLVFSGVNSAKRGLEMFLIKSTKDVHEKLVAGLEEMKSKAGK